MRLIISIQIVIKFALSLVLVLSLISCNMKPGLYDRGKEKFFSDNDTGAINDLTAALMTEKQNDSIYYYRGKSYYSLSRYENAIEDFTKFLQKNNSKEVFLLRGKAKYILKNWSEAKYDFLSALMVVGVGEKKLNGEIYYFLGICSAFEGDADKACEYLTESVNLGCNKAFTNWSLFCEHPTPKTKKALIEAVRN